MIAALFFIFYVHSCQSECPTEFTPNFYMANNHILQNHAFKTITDSSPVICGRECAMDPKCVSFNYQKNYNICELNDITRKQSPCDFMVLPGSFYYDGDSETSFLSVAISVSGKYTSCQELLTAGHHDNGIYIIYPAGLTNGLQVYCDMATDGGGWMVFQRRQDGSVDFYRTWDEYKCGFGKLNGEFWLGNEVLRILTQAGQWQLRVDLWDWEGNTAWAEYGEFLISGEKYTIHIGSYDASSTGGDSLAFHNAQNFTTKDLDNDATEYENCAVTYKGAWWFRNCFHSHLNAKYYHQGHEAPRNQGIRWWLKNVQNNDVSLKQCSMKLRQVA